MTLTLTVQEVADELRVHRNTVYDWIAAGRIKAINIAEKGTRPLMRIRREELEKFLKTSAGRAA